jgi:hypothetical protein
MSLYYFNLRWITEDGERLAGMFIIVKKEFWNIIYLGFGMKRKDYGDVAVKMGVGYYVN